MLTAFNCAKKEDNGWWKKGVWSPGAILSLIERNTGIAYKLRDLQMQYHDVVGDPNPCKDGARLLHEAGTEAPVDDLETRQKELKRLELDFAMLTDEQITQLCSLLDKIGVLYEEEDLHEGQIQREYDFLSNHGWTCFQRAREFVDNCVSDITLLL